MSQVTSPVILDSTGQEIVTQLATISAALAAGNIVTGNTDTTLSGVLQGANGKVAVIPVDSDPTADSTNLVSSGGTDKAIKGRVPVYGMGKNLLRNWYFVGGGTGRGVFPVNQRGQTSYSSNANGAYSVDNWKVFRGTANLQTTGLSLAWGGSSSGNYGCYMRQYIDLNSLLGRTVTLSAFTESGLHTVSFEVSSSYQIDSDTIDDWTLSSNIESAQVTISIWRKSQTAKLLYAAKLELGTEQTLCHNEGTAEAPVWVLNEVPDYEYELYRCMTSTADSSDTYANKTLATGEELAYVENGTTASRAYAVGEYFCKDGLLYRVTAAISNGGTITPRTNCEQVTGGLNDLNTVTLYNIPLNSGYSLYSGGIAKYGKTKNGIVTVSASIRHGTTDISPFEPFTLPDGFRPRQVVTFLARNDNHGYLIMGSIDTSGIATFYSLANAFGSGATFNTGLAFRDVYFDVTFLAS